jgi:hypothetical protein
VTLLGNLRKESSEIQYTLILSEIQYVLKVTIRKIKTKKGNISNIYNQMDNYILGVSHILKLKKKDFSAKNITETIPGLSKNC